MYVSEDIPKDFPDLDLLIANTVNYLIQGNEKETAEHLLKCSAKLIVSTYDDPISAFHGEFILELTGPRRAYELFNGIGSTYWREQLWNAIEAVKPPRYVLTGISANVQTVTALDKDWRRQMETELSGRTVDNQGIQIQDHEIHYWHGLRFRSPHEVRIASALDAAGAMFLPNCRGRLGPKDLPGDQETDSSRRVTREADFLVCVNGKWGVFEVDGSQHEGAAARDHERDRLFKYHGIRVAEHYTAKECLADAPRVVGQFLTLLAQNG